ncbi:MAG: MmgE/PrpD family protein, partial [Pseudomonadota bacterium]
LGFTDTVGVLIAGSREPVTRNLLRHVRATGGRPAARLLLGRERATVAQAALVGTAAAHALDYDDYAYSNHVSALLVPAILAEAERSGGNGADMIEAYVAGYEVWGALMKREPDHLHSKGWHPTGVFGPVGVAAALSRLRRLDAAQCANALGLAAAAGGGVMDNFGTQAKPWQGARAAEAGVVAVELALAGVDAGRDAIDGSGGLLAALSPAGRADLTSAADGLGKVWKSASDGLNIKPHPTVGASQRGIDAALDVQSRFSPAPESIESVTARISEKHAAVMRLHRPTTALQAKFSLEFGVAAALIAGRVGLAELTDEFVGRDDVQRLLAKVRLEIGPDDDPDYPVGAAYDTVSVRLDDGRVLDSERVYRFRGHGQNPMSADEVGAKFRDCVAGHLSDAEADALYRVLSGFGSIDDVDALPILADNAAGAA